MTQAMGWAAALTIIGALLELTGFGVTGAALWEQGRVHNAPPGWLRRAWQWFSAKFGRRRSAHEMVGLAAATMTFNAPRLRIRPGEWSNAMTVEAQVAWLKQYVESIDQELAEAFGAVDKLSTDSRSERTEIVRELRSEIAAVDDKLRDVVVSDLGPAWFGLLVAACGVVIGLVGQLSG